MRIRFNTICENELEEDCIIQAIVEEWDVTARTQPQFTDHSVGAVCQLKIVPTTHDAPLMSGYGCVSANHCHSGCHCCPMLSGCSCRFCHLRRCMFVRWRARGRSTGFADRLSTQLVSRDEVWRVGIRGRIVTRIEPTMWIIFIFSLIQIKIWR